MKASKLYVYKASAGSGKTFRLAVEFVTLLLQEPANYRHILAITFTNKATEEMKQRIVDTLRSIVAGEETPEWGFIRSRFDAKLTDGHLRNQAAKALEYIVFDYGRLNISTIDSFFVKVVRSCARELGLDFGFKIELNSDKILRETTKRLFQSEDKAIQQILLKFGETYIGQDKGWNIDRDITSIGKQLFDAKLQAALQSGSDTSAFFEWVDVLFAEVKDFKKEAQRLSNEIMEAVNGSSISESDFAAHLFSFPKKVIAGDIPGPPEESKALIKAIEQQVIIKGGKKADHSLGVFILPYLEALVSHFAAGYARYLLNMNIAKNIYAAGLLQEVDDVLKAYTTQENTYLLSQMIVKLQANIGDSDAPIIYEKLGTSLKYIFMDEFQDTSNQQWSCFKPLVTEVLGKGGNVFVFGDVKQSIYRWRNGRMQLLLSEVEEEVKATFGADSVVVEPMTDNWRSSQSVIEFNNHFFESFDRTFKAGGFMDIGPDCYPFIQDKVLFNVYDDVQQAVKVGQGRGYVQVDAFETKQRGSTFTEDTLPLLVEQIRDAESRGYSYDRQLILVRNNGEARKIIDYLREEAPEIKYEVAAALLLKRSLKVQVVLHALSYTLDQNTKAHLFNIYQGMNRAGTFDDFIMSVDEALSKQRSKSLLERVIGWVKFFEWDVSQDLYLSQFLDWVADLNKEGVSDLVEFLALWEEVKERLALRSVERTGVEILTIHRAKGLERDIVHVPFADFALESKDSTILWEPNVAPQHAAAGVLPLVYQKKSIQEHEHYGYTYSKELLESFVESMNLIYVAFTRAKEELYVHAGSHDKKMISGNLIAAILDIGVGETFTKGAKLSAKDMQQEEQVPSSPALPITFKTLGALEVTGKSTKMFELESSGEQVVSGLILHRYFELYAANLSHEQSAQLVVDEFVLNNGEVIWLEGTTQKIWQQIPDLKSWYSADYQRLAERSLMYKGRELKPDLVIYNDTETHIVDFKLEKDQPKYKLQLQKYETALSALGFPNIHKHLLFTNTAQLKSI